MNFSIFSLLLVLFNFVPASCFSDYRIPNTNLLLRSNQFQPFHLTPIPFENLMTHALSRIRSIATSHPPLYWNTPMPTEGFRIDWESIRFEFATAPDQEREPFLWPSYRDLEVTLKALRVVVPRMRYVEAEFELRIFRSVRVTRPVIARGKVWNAVAMDMSTNQTATV